MKTLSANDLTTRPADFFEALVKDGCVTITRNGRSFPLRLESPDADPESKKTLGSALAMDMTGLDDYQDWDFPKVTPSSPREIDFER